jgi:hypothetical protein
MAKVNEALILLCVLLSSILTGCLADDDEASSPVTLIVYYENTSGTLYENWTNGQRISQTAVELTFDFARTSTTKGEMKMFSFTPGDGSAPVEIDASQSASLTYEYMTHGLFSATLGAEDSEGNVADMSIIIRIDSFMHWVEQNTDNPESMNLNTIPDCENCEGPTLISIDSQVTNPESVLPVTGGTTTITWNLNNPDGETTATKTEPIADGQTKLWEHDQLGVTLGTWTLGVVIESGEDNINITHDVSIRYEEKETEANPIDVPQ